MSLAHGRLNGNPSMSRTPPTAEQRRFGT